MGFIKSATTQSPLVRRNMLLRISIASNNGASRRRSNGREPKTVLSETRARSSLKRLPASPARQAARTRLQPQDDTNFQVLVINASEQMALEITVELQESIPECFIMYAPTVELARWLMKRRVFHLVVSSPVLPDGSIAGLRSALEAMENKPDLVVVGDGKMQSQSLLRDSAYHMKAIRRMNGSTQEVDRGSNLRALSADLRNDINNPLQEIVAMVFVAQASGALADNTSQALKAIDRAAKNLAQVVWGMEEKILKVVNEE